MGYSQKGKGGPKGDKNKITLFTCAEDLGNGQYMANFGYTNPTNKTITVSPEDSYIFLSDKIEDSEFNGILKIDGITSFEPGTHEKVLSVLFADNGHAKWTVAFGNSNTKIRATFDSPVCEADSFIVPVIGPGNGKNRGFVGPELLSLGAGTAGDTPSSIIYQVDANQRVLIQLVPFDGETQTIINVLENVFGLAYNFDPQLSDFIVDPAIIISSGLSAIDVFFPIDRILPPEPPLSSMPALIDYFDIIKSAQALYTPFTSGVLEETGDAITQGDAAQSTDVVRESYRIVSEEGSAAVDGTGVKIVVFSNSFDANPTGGQQSNEAIDVGAGDLPGTAGNGNPNGYNTPVEVIKEYPYTFGIISDEGRAMLQIAHDIAPGASLAFRTGVLSPRDFELGIKNLSSTENTIALDDITFPGEPMFGISNIGKAIQDFTEDGNYYFTSAGNFSNRAYQAIFQASDGANIPEFVPDAGTVAHIFGNTNDIYQRFSVKSGETYMIVLQWDEDFASQDNMLGAASDLDFWVVDDQQRLLVGNNYYNDGEDDIENDARDPIEYITFRATADGEANFMITSANGNPGALPFRYIIFIPNSLEVLEFYDGAPTMSGHTLTPAALAIGAVDFRKSLNSEPFTPQPFSSFAGILPGALPTDIAVAQVALSSFDGVNTNVQTIGQNEVAGVPVDGDPYKNFFGTSASVVHVAAAFALTKSAIPSWYGSENSLDILQLFKDNATKVGFEDQLGEGVVNAVNAFKQLAAQTAIQITLAVNEGQVDPEGVPLVLSADSVQVTLTGKYFPPAPEDPNAPDPLTVYFGEGEDRITLEIDEATRTDTELVVTVPPFIANPKVVVNTAPLAGTVNNGGDSNALPIIEDGRIALRITANEVEIEYGQAFEDKFDFTVEGLPAPYADGLPDDKNLNDVLVELGLSPLPEIIFETNSEPPYPKVSNYRIFPCFDGTVDCSGTKVIGLPEYIVTFKSGSLIVTKKDLEIIPEPITTNYGETIILDLNYLYDSTGITNNEDFLAAISTAHTTTFDTNNNLALINGFKALVNDEQVAILNLLENGSWIATDRTIENGFKALVNQGNLLNLNTTHFDDYSDYLTNGFKALVNDFKALVNSEDLFNGVASFGSIQNGFKALVNDSDLGSETDENDYSQIFTIAYDGDGDAPISQFYSLNLITGLGVTPFTDTDGDGISEPEVHYSFPGAFLNSIAYNFNIIYNSNEITVLPAVLEVQTSDLQIKYGANLTAAEIISGFTGFAYDEDENIFLDEFVGIPYYFIRLKEDGTPLDDTELEIDELQELGEYLIKIRDPKNYLIKPVNNTFGTLTIEPVELQFDPAALSVTYGETPVIEPGFGPFAYDDDASTIFPEAEGGIPYYFKKVGGDDTQYTIGGPIKMDVGDYEIFITDDPTDNYTIVPDVERGTLTIDPATLTVKTEELEIPYGTEVSVAIATTIAGFGYDDEDLTTVFPDGNGGSKIPYLFTKGTDEPLGIEDVTELGTYVIAVEAPSSGNYVIAYDPGHSTLTIGEAPLTFTSLAITVRYGEAPLINPNFAGFAPLEDESVLYVDGQLPYYFMKDGDFYTLVDLSNMNVGDYQIFIEDDPSDNYDFSPDANLGTLTIENAILTFEPSDITVTYGETPTVGDASITGFVFNENALTVFPDGLPYYFEDSSGNLFGPNDRLNAGDYEILITDYPDDNYTIVGATGTLSVNKAILTATIEDLLIDEGETIDPASINTFITGYAYNEGEQEVFQGGIQYRIEDVEGNPYMGVDGIYFIKIEVPSIFNYTIEYNRVGTVYVNSNDVNRKIRTYTDCVEENPGDPDGLYYIAHFRYVNPNDEAIYILAGPENRLTGSSALTASGELPFKFLPGEHTFEIRFDGNSLKWELISLDSNHKTSTTTNVNSNSNKCSSSTTNEGGIPTYILHPNPVKDAEGGILYIEQDIPGMVTLEVFDFFGILYHTEQLDGTNAPSTHQIYMSGSSYPVGMYFIRLTANGDVQVLSVIKAE